MRRLQNVYGHSAGNRLYGFWSSMCTLGDEVTLEQFPKQSFIGTENNWKKLACLGAERMWWSLQMTR
jgi:hypothetical protein